MLSGNVVDGILLHRLGLQCCVTFKGEDDLSDLDLLTLLYPNFLHYSAHARWNFHDSLVGFEFHDWLAFGNLSAGRDHQADEITCFDLFAKFRKSEFCGRRRRRRSLAALALRLRSLCWFLLRCLWLRWLGLGFRNFRFSFGFCSSTVLNCEDDLADFDFLAFFYPNVFYRAAYGRGNLDNGFVGFEFHHWLAFGDACARRDHETHEVALFDVLAEFGKFEFDHCKFPGLFCVLQVLTTGGQRNTELITLADCWVRLLRIDAEVFYSLLDLLYFDLFFTRQRVQRYQHNVFGVNFEP